MNDIARIIERLGCPVCFANRYKRAETDRDLCAACHARHAEN